MSKGVVRLGLSMEPDLLVALDRWVELRNSGSRSEAVRALIRKELGEEKLEDPEADAVGCLLLLYRHDTPNVLSRLTAAEHRWGEHIRSTTHVHLEGDACSEVVLLLGRRREIEEAAEDLRGVKGVRDAGWLVTAPAVAGGRTGHHHPHAGVARRPGPATKLEAGRSDGRTPGGASRRRRGAGPRSARR